jgi:protein-tyrosine phosphatase
MTVEAQWIKQELRESKNKYMVSVLFVCTGNQYRSPIAAETFRGQLTRDGRAGQWMVSSAGTWTSSGRQALPDAVELARSFGVNIDGHTTRMLDAKMLEDADLVFVMEQGHKESIQVEFPFAKKKVYLLSQVLDELAYDIPDPASAQSEAREIIRDLVAMVRAGSGNIYRIAESA